MFIASVSQCPGFKFLISEFTAEKEERNLPVAYIKTPDIVKKAAELLHVSSLYHNY